MLDPCGQRGMGYRIPVKVFARHPLTGDERTCLSWESGNAFRAEKMMSGFWLKEAMAKRV